MSIFSGKVKITLCLIVVVAVFAGLLLWNFLLFSFYGNEVNDVVISNRENFRMERVSDEAKMSLGLGGRKWMCENCGMIFDFGKRGRNGFWMKGMKFPLDIIWSLNGKVVWIENNVSYKTSSRIYNPPVDSDTVLELNAGLCGKRGIRTGDDVKIISN